MSPADRRFQRQFDALTRLVPPLKRPLGVLRRRGWQPVRILLALFFIAGGVFSFLPFLGAWMLPLGFLLLAVDLPFLRRPISALNIRTRRRLSIWARKLRNR
jgi:hypothetical protein